MKKTISIKIAKYINDMAPEEIYDLLEIPPVADMGDFSLPCFTMAKKFRKAPAQIAVELKEQIEKNGDETGFTRIQAVNGYLNFFLNRKEYMQEILSGAIREDYGTGTKGAGKVICMDYSSPNIAKNFHVGHLRTTIIGNSLYKIYAKLGYQIVRINHLGDWGTQFGKLIVAYRKWSSRELVEEKGIEELLRIYVLFNAEAEKDPVLNDEARAWFAEMEKGNPEALALWEWFKEISMVDFARVYRLLGVDFDFYTGESFYMDKVPAVVAELKQKGLLEESEGTNIVSLEQYEMPPCLITKKDGSSIYHSRDLAAVLYRQQEYHFDKCLYVTGMEQKLHFAQVFKVIELMGYEWHRELIHVPYGLVSLEGAKLSTRTGNIIYAEDILKESIKRAMEIIEQKNPVLPEKEQTAEKVGVGAIIFHDLYNQRIKNVSFSWENVLNFDGASGPYVQYTYARAGSILRKAQAEGKESIDARLLTTQAEYELVKVIDRYPEKIKEAAERFEPFILARYAIELAAAFNKFYQDCPILTAAAGVKTARLGLTGLARKIIRETMGLLGIECPEAM